MSTELLSIYSDNVFNTSPGATSINEINLKAELNPDFHIDLLTIFNNIDVDESLMFMQIYGDMGYPIFKIYREILNDNNMVWITKWCKASTAIGKIDVGDDTQFEKLIVKIRLPDNEGKYPTLFTSDMTYFTMELHPAKALLFIRFYIRNEANVSIESLKEIIDYANKFLERCSELNIYTIPLEYLQGGSTQTTKMLKLFTDGDPDDTTINFFQAINFINISIQQYWDVLGANIPRSYETMHKLLSWFTNHVRDNDQSFNIILASNKIVENHIHLIYRFNDEYMKKNEETICKLIIRYIKKAKMSYSAFIDMINGSPILRRLDQLYPSLFTTVKKFWQEFMTKTTIVMNNYIEESVISDLIQHITYLFGINIIIGLNNINVLGILNVGLMYMIQNALAIMLTEFITNPNASNEEYIQTVENQVVTDDYSLFNVDDIDINFDDIDLNVDFDFDEQDEKLFNNPDKIPDNELPAPVFTANDSSEFKYEIDEHAFDVYEGYHGDDKEELAEIKKFFLNYEREIMANEMATLTKKGKPKIHNALTRLQKFDQLIGLSKNYASDCQSDKKPIILTLDEYKKLEDKLNNNTNAKLTPFGEYVSFIVRNAEKFDNPYYYYICCMIYDFHSRSLINPYCAYVKMGTQLESVYYIPFSTANDLFVTEKWHPKGDNYINRYDETKIVKRGDSLFYPDPSNNDELVEMIRIFPNVSRFHCIDFNASKNYVALPYKFIPDIVKKINLPCCFSKTQVIPNTVSNYNNSLHANNETYRDYPNMISLYDYVNMVQRNEIIYDGVNRTIQLPRELNILFNNNATYADKVIKDEWCRRAVFQGYFINLFDFFITDNIENGSPNYTVINHSSNDRMPLYKRPRVVLLQYLIKSLVDEKEAEEGKVVFQTLKNGLIRYMFKTKEEFIKYCIDNYMKLNEDLLWEWISATFKVNIFIIEKVKKTSKEAEQYRFVFPQGYDINKLYQYDMSMFVYKYINSKSEVIYDLIDKVVTTQKTKQVNIDKFNPFIPTSYAFVQTIKKLLEDTNTEIFFDPNVKSYIPTAVEFVKNINQNVLPIVGQTRTVNLEYTDCVIFRTPKGENAILPVYPITLLPDDIPVYTNLKLPLYSRSQLNELINVVNDNQDTGEVWYYPRAVITDQTEMISLGFIFDKNIHIYYKPIHYRTNITPDRIGDPTLELVKQFFKSNNSIVSLNSRTSIDDDRDSYISRKDLVKSLIFSVEYMLSTKISPEWREELSKYFNLDVNKEWDQLGKLLYNFVSKFIDKFTIVDDSREYEINTSRVNMSNIISTKDKNLITSIKGSNIQNCYAIDDESSCNEVTICKWDENMCKACFNNAELKNNVINYIVNELLSSFNSMRYKIMYGSSFSTEPKVLQNYHPESQYVVNSANSGNAINTLNNLIRGDELSSLAENMKMVYILTHNFNDIQKMQVDAILTSLRNEIDPSVLFKVESPCLSNIYYVKMQNDKNDLWFTMLLSTTGRSGICTVPAFRKALADLIISNKYIRSNGKYIYNGFLLTRYYEQYLYHLKNENNKPKKRRRRFEKVKEEPVEIEPPVETIYEKMFTKGKYGTMFENMIDVFLSNEYTPTLLDLAALMLAPWNDYHIVILTQTGDMYVDDHGLLEKSYIFEEWNTFKQGNSIQWMIHDVIPPNTPESEISDATVFKNRKDYLVFVEYTFDTTTVYKQLIKYDPETEGETFVFTSDDIDCIRENSYNSTRSNPIQVGNIPYNVWYWGVRDVGRPTALVHDQLRELEY